MMKYARIAPAGLALAGLTFAGLALTASPISGQAAPAQSGPAQPAAGPGAPGQAAPLPPAREYDFLIKGGRVIDARNSLDAIRDVAIKDGKIAAVAAGIPAAKALKTVDAKGLLVTPGLVDIHVHVFPGEKQNDYAGGDWSVFPDDHTLPSCVTTVSDAGSSGWRNFPDFKTRVIDKSTTRVTAFLNIVGAGMGSGPIEQNLQDMDVQATADMAARHKGVVVGIKSAHFAGPEWTPYEKAEEVGKLANIPVMVDFGSNVRQGRTLEALFTKYFRKGDIYTHMYGGRRGEQDPNTQGPSAAMLEGRKRGVIFDVGHGGTSFRYATAVPLIKAGFLPDSISTDLHHNSMNAAMKSMLNVMGKFLAMGLPMDKVIAMSTWNPAKQIQLKQLGNLSVGSPADVAVIRVEKGSFGFVDPLGGRLDAQQRLVCEMTIRNGKMVYELNGLARDKFDPSAPETRGDPRWDGFARPAQPAGQRPATAGARP